MCLHLLPFSMLDLQVEILDAEKLIYVEGEEALALSCHINPLRLLLSLPSSPVRIKGTIAALVLVDEHVRHL